MVEGMWVALEDGAFAAVLGGLSWSRAGLVGVGLRSSSRRLGVGDLEPGYGCWGDGRIQIFVTWPNVRHRRAAGGLRRILAKWTVMESCDVGAFGGPC